MPSHREHVTPFINSQPQRFRQHNVCSEQDLSQCRWTVDNEADYELVGSIYNALYPSKPDFDTADILRFLEQNRELNALNAHLTRNEGLQKSLLQDEQYRRADEQQHDGDCLP